MCPALLCAPSGSAAVQQRNHVEDLHAVRWELKGCKLPPVPRPLLAAVAAQGCARSGVHVEAQTCCLAGIGKRGEEAACHLLRYQQCTGRVMMTGSK